MWEQRGNSCCSINEYWESPLWVSRVTCADTSWCSSLAGAAVTWKGDRSLKHQHLCVKKPYSFPSSGLWCLMEKIKYFTGEEPLNWFLSLQCLDFPFWSVQGWWAHGCEQFLVLGCPAQLLAGLGSALAAALAWGVWDVSGFLKVLCEYSLCARCWKVSSITSDLAGFHCSCINKKSLPQVFYTAGLILAVVPC